MAIDIKNVGTRQVVEATFLAQAVDAGIITTIKSLVNLAADEITLLIHLKTVLAEDNPPLAEALNLDTLRAILRYAVTVDRGLGYADSIPDLLDANGPAAVWPVYYPDKNGDRVEIGTPIEEKASREGYEGFHVLIDGGLYYSGDLPTDSTANLVFTAKLLPGEHTLRVCYIDAECSTTRLSPPATFTVS